MHEVFRQSAGEAWTAEIDRAWRAGRLEVARVLGHPPPTPA
jgi:hypothetical protein